MAWRIRGSYLESCNCDAICPCRRVNGEPGGRSTHGESMGALSWDVEEGAVDDLDLAGRRIALAFHYDDDEPGSPWTWTLYLDEDASPAQRDALEDMFSGRLGGDSDLHFPWFKQRPPVAVRSVAIEIDHTPRRQWLRVRDHVELRIRDAFGGDAQVTCGISGHHQHGDELIADELRVDEGVLDFTYRGVCGYTAPFDYAG
jgi:hypothetical protein